MEVEDPNNPYGYQATTMDDKTKQDEYQSQQERRNSIRDIMADQSLSEIEKRRSIQSLMDGRRRSSNGTSRSSNGSVGEMAAAAQAAAEFYATQSCSDTAASSEYNGSYSSTSNGSSNGGTPFQQPNGGLGHDGGDDWDQTHDQPVHQRRKRSSSLPNWSSSTDPPVPFQAGQDVGSGSGGATHSIWDDPIMINQRMEKSRPKCHHYERTCTIISPCCGLAFGCRICHDESPVLPLPFSKRQAQAAAAQAAAAAAASGKQEKRRSLPLGFDEEETHHLIDRFAIAEVICRMCYVRQSSKSNQCINCGVQFGAYHCGICNLWMSDDEAPYHCDACGFCRVGGRENFRHCDDCGMCIDTLLFDDHNCKAGKYMSNCPVCQEDLFSSRDASHEMPCGHAIHWHCFKELTSYDTRCPVCKKTAETPEHMAPTWQAMAMGIALQPVPPELARVVTIICNDCEEQDMDRRWHFLGVRCNNCSSFNTTIERTTMTGREAAAFLDERDALTAEEYDGDDSDDQRMDDGGGSRGHDPMDADA